MTHVLASSLIALTYGAPHLSAQSGLSGVVRDSVQGTSVPGAVIALTGDTLRPNLSAVPSRLRTLTDSNGEFHILDLTPGRYLLHAQVIGYQARWISVEIGADEKEFVVVRMWGLDLCLGHCGPDPVKLAYARSRRAEWGCQLADPKNIESERQSWVRSLAQYPLALPDSAHVTPALPRDSAQLVGLIRHVTDRVQCRRAGEVYDREFGATDTHFLVYEAGPVLFVSNPWGGDGTLVLDRRYGVLIRYIVE